MAKSCPPLGDPAPGAETTSSAGRSFPQRYRKIEKLAEGGMGSIFKAWDAREKRWVALKSVRALRPEDLPYLEREIRLLSQLRHEGIVRLLDAGRSGEELFFTMELLRGISLASFLGRGLPGKDEIHWILGVAAKALAALEYVHASGWIHGDVKPSNIFVELPGDRSPSPEAALSTHDPSVKLLDFGLARHRESFRRLSAWPAGTPLYMAPEQIEGASDLDDRADIYAIGAVLYHLIAQRPPFQSFRSAILRSPAPPEPQALNPACSRDLSFLIESFVAREPHRRPSSAAEARDAILGLLEPSRRAAVAAPRLLSPTFVGRREEIERLKAFLRRAAEGQGICVRVAGESGSGKTWFLERSGIRAEAALEHRMFEAAARCRSEGAVYSSLRVLVRELAEFLRTRTGRIPEAAERWELVPSQAVRPELELQGTEPESPEEAAARSRLLSERAYRDFLEVLAEAARESPLLLALEDLHAADDAEVELAARIARSIRELPVAFVITYAPEKLHKGGALSRWAAESSESAATIRLSRLTDREVEELLGAMLRPSGAISARLISEVSHDGKPRSVIRAIQTLWECGELRFEGGLWDYVPISRGAVAAPDWRARLAELDPDEASLAAAAWVLPSPFEEDLAAEFLDAVRRKRHRCRRSSGGVRAAPGLRPVGTMLRSLVRKGLVLEDPGGFRKPEDLGEPAIAEHLGPKALKDFHGIAAELLLDRYRSVLEEHAFAIAERFRIAGRRAKAAELYLIEARHARSIFANRRSIEAYRKALELTADRKLKAQIAEELGDVYARVGEYAKAFQSYETARSSRRSARAGSPGGVAPDANDLELLDKIGRVLHRQGKLAEALDVFSRSLELVPSRTSGRARALFRIGSIHLERGDPSAARRYLQESVAVYQELGDRRQIVAALSGLGLAEKYEDRLDLAAQYFEEALRNAEESGYLPDIATALNNLGNALRALGDDRGAIECLEKSIDARQRVGDRQGLGICLNNIARVYAFRGDILQAIGATERALSVFEEIGDRKGVLIARSNLGELAHIRSEFGKAAELFAGNLELAEGLRLHRLYAANLCNLADLELDKGGYEAALAYARKCLAALADEGPKEFRAQALGAAAAASAALGDIEAASDSLREAFDIASELNLRERVGVLGALKIRLCLERGQADEALGTARAVQERLERTADRYSAARFHRELGRMYRELGPDWADLTEKFLGGALRSFEAMGSRHQCALTRAELAIYWRLQGEEAEASRLFQTAADELSSLGLSRRLAEIERLRQTP